MSRSPPPPPIGAVRAAYAAHPGGARGWYAERGATYRNPHEDGVRDAIAGLVADGVLGDGPILDLACGSGEVTLALRDAGVRAEIDGADPFTGAAYEARTGRAALPWSFEELPAALVGRRYAAVVCSMALHLCPPSRLPGAVLALAAATPTLVVLTPHKRPVLAAAWGFAQVREHRDPASRLRVRVYRATAAW